MSFISKIENNVFVFTLDNVANGNTIDTELLQGLNAAIDQVNENAEIKGLILTGQDRFFCSGLSIRSLLSFTGRQEIINWFKLLQETFYKLFVCTKPVIAAINGHCVGAGMLLALSSDYRLVLNNPKTKIALPEIKLGMGFGPATGEIVRFGLGSDKNYKDIMFSGEPFSPQAAIDYGIFDEIVDDAAELMAKAFAKAIAYYGIHPHAFALLKDNEKKHSAKIARDEFDVYNWDEAANQFTNEKNLASLRKALDKPPKTK